MDLKIKVRKTGTSSGSRAIKAVKGELHNVLSLMRRSEQIGSSKARFSREIPLKEENHLLRLFKEVHESLHAVQDLNSIPALKYLSPFLISIRESGLLTAISVASVNKFLLYGILNRDSNGVRAAINAIADAVSACSHSMAEVVSMKNLELMVHCVRSDCGHLLTDDSVWKLFESCYAISQSWDTSALLRHTSENTIAHIVLTIFSRVADFAQSAREERARLPAMGGGFGGIGGISTPVRRLRKSDSIDSDGLSPVQATPAPDDLNLLKVVDDFTLSNNEEMEEEGRNRSIDHEKDVQMSTATNVTNKSDHDYPPYEVGVLYKVLRFLASLTEPNANDEDARILALSLINIVLETAGDALSEFPSLVEVLRCDMCKYLLQNSQSEELPILSLTLRVVYNLFNSIKSHLKVQLEVFLISVHLRIADSDSASFEQKELALESLLDFCLEPALMHDLFVNYDCDVQCTNLFEDLCKCLCRNAQPRDGKLNALQLLALEGLNAVLTSMAKRCKGRSIDSPSNSPSKFAVATPSSAMKKGDSMTAQKFAKKKKEKQSIALVVEQFNKKPKLFVKKAVELGVFKEENPSPAVVAKFLFEKPQGLDPKVLGEYLSEPPDKYPFNVAVLQQFTKLFDFQDVEFVDAMRLFLNSFRLPGEAQKIDRLVEAMAKQYYKFSPGPFADEDAIYVLAFSTIMLNTDLHNPMVEKKMKLEDFVRNNQGSNGGGDLPFELQESIYNSILEKAFDLVPGPKASRELVPSDTEHWNGLMKRSQNLNGFEASNEEAIFHFAGEHEREMFAPIASQAMSTLFAVF
eukprot:g3286.t1